MVQKASKFDSVEPIPAAPFLGLGGGDAKSRIDTKASSVTGTHELKVPYSILSMRATTTVTGEQSLDLGEWSY